MTAGCAETDEVGVYLLLTKDRNLLMLLCFIQSPFARLDLTFSAKNVSYACFIIHIRRQSYVQSL